MADITMPQLGETVTEGTITRWLKQVGDRVEEDELLYEVSTDKVDSEVPSPVAGFIAEIVVPEGETAEVGAKLAVIADAPPAGGEAPAPAEAEAAAPEPEPEPTPAQPETPAAPETSVQPDEQEAAADEAATAEVEQAGQPEPAAAQAPPAAPAAEAPSAAGAAGKVLSPVVRRLITENNLDPNQIQGTGAGGRITRADVLALIDQKGTGAAPAAAPAPAAPTQTPAPPPPPAAAPSPAPAPAPAAAPAIRPGERDEVVPFSNIRRRTAEHMVRSLQTSAHTLVAIEVDYERIEQVRQRHKDRFRQEEGVGLSYLPFIATAVVDAVREYPHVNATVADGELIVHHYVNLGIAVDLNFEGLIVPVVRDADTKRLRALAREMGDLANKARSKKLSADDISGGTFTLTNAGGYGTLLTGPIINQPQVAILSTDGVKPQPVAVPLADGGYGVAVHHVGNLALSFDHRAYDGAYASAFLAKVKDILETRDWETEL